MCPTPPNDPGLVANWPHICDRWSPKRIWASSNFWILLDKWREIMDYATQSFFGLFSVFWAFLHHKSLSSHTISPWTRVICPTKIKNWRTLKSFWGIIYHICGVSLPPIPGHLELGGTQRIDILIKVILHCKMVQIGHFQRVIREVSRGCLMVPIFLTGQDMSIFRWSGEILKKNLTGLA